MVNWTSWITDAVDVEIAKSISERVHDAFQGNKEREILKDYLQQIYSNLQITEIAVRKSMMRLVFLIFMFFLLMNTQVDELGVGPLKVKDFSIIIILLPLLISINFYELISLGNNFFSQKRLVRRIFLFAYAPIEKNNLELFLEPSLTPLYNEGILQGLTDGGYLRMLSSNLQTMIVVLTILSSIIMEVFVFSACFKKFGFNLLLIMALIVSLVFFIKTYIDMIIWTKIANYDTEWIIANMVKDVMDKVQDRDEKQI